MLHHYATCCATLLLNILVYECSIRVLQQPCQYTLTVLLEGIDNK